MLNRIGALLRTSHKFSARAIGLSVKQHATAGRSQQGRPFLDVFQRVLPDYGIVLEIGSGTGQHVRHFARRLRGLEVAALRLRSGRGRQRRVVPSRRRLSNVREPLLFEVREALVGQWAAQRSGRHQSRPCHGVVGLRGVVRRRASSPRPDGVLFLYGPFKQAGGFETRDNAQLDAKLRERNPDWGLRDFEAVVALGRVRGMHVEQVVDMPAGNSASCFGAKPTTEAPLLRALIPRKREEKMALGWPST